MLIFFTKDIFLDFGYFLKTFLYLVWRTNFGGQIFGGQGFWLFKCTRIKKKFEAKYFLGKHICRVKNVMGSKCAVYIYLFKKEMEVLLFEYLIFD